MAEAQTGRVASTRKPPKRKLLEEHARGYLEAAGRRDPGAMLAHWADDGVEDVVPLGVFRGKDELRALFEGLFAAAPDLETTVGRVVADDRRAIAEWRMTGTFDGAPFQGLDPTGRRVELRGIDVLEIVDGQIVGNTAYYDGAAFARQVGILPAQDSGAERALKGAFNAVTRVRRMIEERGRS